MEKCKLCGIETDHKFEIQLYQIPICFSCVRNIMRQLLEFYNENNEVKR